MDSASAWTQELTEAPIRAVKSEQLESKGELSYANHGSQACEFNNSSLLHCDDYDKAIELTAVWQRPEWAAAG